MKIRKAFFFDAAHRLEKLPPDHKCSRLHGHTWKVVAEAEGPVNQTYDWIMDFALLSLNMNTYAILDLDHRYLNDIPGLENSTCEVLAKWIYDRVKPHLKELSAIEVFESRTASAYYAGN